MERFKLTDLGNKKVMMAFDGSGWRIIESLEVKLSGNCPACGMDTSSSPGAYYAVPRPKNKGKAALALCTHAPAEVEEARKCLESRI
jgi:hypothetical protein